MVVQAKICSVKGSSQEASYQDLILEWKRGDTIETSAPFGEIVNNSIDINVAIIFNKLSIFFRQENTQPAVYQEKRSTIGLYSQVGKQKVFLGEGDFELSQFVGKIRQEFDVRLAGGPLINGLIHIQVSICPINQAPTLGVDTKLLLEESPSIAKK